MRNRALILIIILIVIVVASLVFVSEMSLRESDRTIERVDVILDHYGR